MWARCATAAGHGRMLLPLQSYVGCYDPAVAPVAPVAVAQGHVGSPTPVGGSTALQPPLIPGAAAWWHALGLVHVPDMLGQQACNSLCSL